MCVNFFKTSGMLSRALLASFCLLLLEASPLAAWPIKPAENQVLPESPKELTLSTPVEPEMKSTESSERTQSPSQIPSEPSMKYSEPSDQVTMTQEQFTTLLAEIQKAKTTAEAAAEIEAIEDALEADTRKEAEKVIEEYNQLAGENARQAEEIVSLAQEAKSKFYTKIGGVIGFEDTMMPTWGVSISAGTKIGKNVLLEAGVEYDIGTFIKPIQGITDPSIDRLRITGSVGWLF